MSLVSISKQRGAFWMARALLVLRILVAILLIPACMKKDPDRKPDARQKDTLASQRQVQVPAKTAPGRNQQPAAPEPASQPRDTDAGGIGYGLTYGLDAQAVPPFGERIGLTCRATGEPLERPQQGACNPAQGDTSCRMVLPLLCIKTDSAATADAALAGRGNSPLGATRPVMGAVLESHAFASARCAKELGPGWRATDTQDAQGHVLGGLRDSGLAGQGRYWVVAAGKKDRGNCWSGRP